MARCSTALGERLEALHGLGDLLRNHTANQDGENRHRPVEAEFAVHDPACLTGAGFIETIFDRVGDTPSLERRRKTIGRTACDNCLENLQLQTPELEDHP